jgi:bifunctional NMN adenylyltransferase/nudix hydrolase
MKPTSWTDKSVSPMYNLAVVIGRFQPFHNGHFTILKNASVIADEVLVVVGSSFIASNIKNPFSFQDRLQMIESVCEEHNIKNVIVVPVIDDLYNNQQWITAVQNEVDNYTKPGDRVVMVGHHSDESSWYLDAFPEYALEEIAPTETMHSTQIRDIYFSHSMIPANVMPKGVEKYLKEFQKKEAYKNLVEEYVFIKDYKSKYANAPFPPIFSTVDAVVINSGHLLLVKRRTAPGKGLWALPGGFLNSSERIEDSMLRELEEETRIKVSREHLRSNIKGSRVFDHPERSLRGRTITHAFLIVLQEKKLPKVRGSDDAERAKWVSLSEFYNISNEMYEDHYSIASYMINRA